MIGVAFLFRDYRPESRSRARFWLLLFPFGLRNQFLTRSVPLSFPFDPQKPFTETPERVSHCPRRRTRRYSGKSAGNAQKSAFSPPEMPKRAELARKSALFGV